MRDKKILTSNILIHSFATAHAIAAATLSQTMLGDEAVLTPLTIAMIIALCKVYNAPMTWSGALTIFGLFSGFYLGTRGATLLVKWIPGIGNTANALSTIFTTEIIGWSIVYLLRRDKNITNITKREIHDAIIGGKELRNRYKNESKKLDDIVRNKMTNGDRAIYNSIINHLSDKTISEEEREFWIDKLNDLFEKYLSK